MPRVRKIRRRKINRSTNDAARLELVMSRGVHEPSPVEANRVVTVGGRLFTVKLNKLMQGQPGFELVASAHTHREAMAYPNEYRAELTVVDADFGGPGAGVPFARDLNERSPGCAFMLVCGPMTTALAQTIWIYGTDAWSVITQATAQNPAHFAEVVSSAVRGITWLEPGVRRVLRSYGPRPPSVEERKLSFLDGGRPMAA